jgi:hypothetical protein
MIFSQKIQTVGSVRDFLGVSPAKVEKVTKSRDFSATALMSGLTLGVINQIPSIQPQAVPAMAMPMTIMGLSMSDKIIHAFDPIVQLLQGMSYPVCFIMLSAGFLVIMTGNRAKGLNLIKWAAIGYIGMQLAPAIMAILVEVGKAMGQ